jgi:hypothetical protein
MHSLLLAKRVLPDLLRWHFVRYPKVIARQYVAYAKALASVFSFFYLLRTLLSPWKAIADVYPSRGFNLAEISSVFALNMTARGIGAFIRLVTIVVGVLAQVACLAFFLSYIAAWIAFPVLLPLSIVTFFGSLFA